MATKREVNAIKDYVKQNIDDDKLSWLLKRYGITLHDIVNEPSKTFCGDNDASMLNILNRMFGVNLLTQVTTGVSQ